MQISSEKIAAFIFGVVFVAIMLAIAIWIPKPSKFQLFVFRVVLALAAAGVAAMVPGFISIEINDIVRAGGAIAVFAILYFVNPASMVVEAETGPEPEGDAREVAEAYLAIADSLNFEKVWSAFSAKAHAKYNKRDFIEAFTTVREPLGDVINRQFVGSNAAENPPGWSGHFKTFQFKTEFENSAFRLEVVTATDENKAWAIAGHTIHELPPQASI